MVNIIVLFNHKGGVSKTTTTLNLGWKLAEKGKRVILADFDPQCNLTGMMLDFKDTDQLTKLYETHENLNIKDGLAPAFESRPSPLKPIECVFFEERDNLSLLPGHIGLSEYEVTLGIAQELSGSIQALQNLPGSIIDVLQKTALENNADYILVDTSPSLSSLNRNLLMTCDYFLVPASPDFYSVMALDSLSKILPDWFAWATHASELNVLKSASYPFPKPHPKFLGVLVQKYRPRVANAPARQFQNWIDKIERQVKETLVPAFTKSDLMLPISKYTSAGISDNFILSFIPDFNSLIAVSQEKQKPVFTITEKDTGLSGIVLERTMKSKEQLNDIFSTFADKIIQLTSDG